MGPLQIIKVAPGVELLLRLGQIGEDPMVESLGLERAVESFILALGLGVVGSAVADPDA